jgi:eukaryotic-like serine/threonine-protein kinase
MSHIDDTGCPEAIRNYVRSDEQIELTGYIRKGFNGEVYFAKRRKLDDEVVLKFYRSKPGYDSSEEAVMLKGIDHPNILRIYDLRFVPPEYAFFLSPRISGGDLQTHIDTELFSSKDSLKIISDILNGVTELHSGHDLVHRDLKPGNVLIDFLKRTAIIADLGAVKKIQQATGYVTASKATRVYLPPEAIQNNRYYFQSDLYQVGIIMFQLLGGFFPVSYEIKWLSKREAKAIECIRNSIQKALKFDEIIDKKICNGTLANTNTLPVYLDNQFKRVMNRALHINYKQRYQSSSEFLKAVHSLERAFPNYTQMPDLLLISHDTGKEYKIYKDKKSSYILEKTLNGKIWRKDNNHNGDYESVLHIARQK